MISDVMLRAKLKHNCIKLTNDMNAEECDAI